MDERTMFELLEVYDAVKGVEKIEEMLCGVSQSCGYGEGIIGNLSYVSEIIRRYSKEVTSSKFLDLLADKTMDNHQKARLLLA